MDKNKIIENEKDRLAMLVNELGINSNILSVELGYKNNNSIQRIKNGIGSIASPSFTKKVIKRYPFVSLAFLKNGELPILLSPEEQMIQNNLLASESMPAYPELMALNMDNKLSLVYKEVLALKSEIKELKEIILKQKAVE